MSRIYGTPCFTPYHHLLTKLEVNVINKYSTSMTMDDIAKKHKITTSDVRHILYRAILTVKSSSCAKNIWSKLSKEESINSCTDEQVEYPYYLLTQVRPEYTNACRDFDREKLRTLEDAKKNSARYSKEIPNLESYCKTNDATKCPQDFSFLVDNFQKIKEMESNFIFWY